MELGGGVVEEAAKESKEQFRRRHDWFQSGVVTPRIAVRILDHARSMDQRLNMTAEELSDGTYYVSKWRDTTELDQLYGSTEGASSRRSALARSRVSAR